ncbi:uncharacterized protein [Eleutherodactylus coqui]|uniref:uncharacterized protein isoform X2 n=1 Tax=Eleutherodactylus coqui TaxID=57060 RepID=UPI00346188E7
MLMDVLGTDNKTLDGFYNELRRKYPDAFNLATDLGRRNGSLQKLPHLEKVPSPILGIPPNSPNMASSQRWSPDSFLSKVKYQKTHNEQRKEVEKPQQSGNAVIIKNQAMAMPTWTRKDYLEAQNGVSFQLPTLRTQIEQNKIELKSRLNSPKKMVTNQTFTLQTSNSAEAKTSSDYTTKKSTNDCITKLTNGDNTTTKTSRDYITTKSANDYIITQTFRDYPTTKSPDDYLNTQINGDYTTTKTSRDYITTKSANDYIITQTFRDYPTTKSPDDYLNTQTNGDYTTTKTSRDCNATKPTNDYSTTKTSQEYTNTKPTNDYTTAKTSGYYTNTKPARDYTTIKTSRDYIITKTTNTYSTTQTIGDYNTARVYTTTKPTKDYTTTQTTRGHNTAKTSRDYTTTKSTKDYTTTRERSPSQGNVPGVKSDPLGTIMKELLPDKPSRLIKDLPKTTNGLSNNGGFVSDSDSGVSTCAPMKVFRTQIIQRNDNPVTRYSKSSINFNEKIPQGPTRARVHFEDESKEDAEFRYQERCLLERTQTTKMSTSIPPGPQIKQVERNTKSETTERSSLPREGEKPKSTDQQTTTLPHRRQPFPPNVAKKVLIDIPRGGLPSRHLPQIRVTPVIRDTTNKQFSPRNATSLDGITMSFTNTNHDWREPTQSITAMEGDERGHHSLSSLETLDSGTTEVSSEVSIMKKEWGESNSSIGSGNQSRSSSQNRDLNLEHTSRSKGPESSFYSKVRRSLRLKKKPRSEAASGSLHSDFIFKNFKDLEPEQRTYTSKEIDGGVHGKSSPHGAAIHRLPNQNAANASIPSRININRTKKDIMGDVDMQGTERTHPVKAPYSPMRMMQTLLKKRRVKDYLVRVPSPPPQEARPSTPSRYRGEQIPDPPSGRVLAIQPDSSRLVELERPKMGFSGLYLTKKNQNGHSGLYVVQLSRVFTSSFPQGILEVGDEIVEINRLQAKDLRLDEIYTLLEESSCVLLRVSRNVSSSS